MDPAALLALLRRRWIPVVACLVAGIAGALLITATTPKTYRASARLFVNIPAARGVQEALQGVQLSSQLLESYAKIGTSRSVAERVATRLDDRFSAGEIRSKLSARPQPETLLIDVEVVDGDPTSARDIANAAATTITEVIGELEADKAGAVEARIVDPAVVPTSPISPRPRLDLAIGLVLGLGGGLALAGLLDSLDKSITSSEQAKAAYGAPVLAMIPRHRRPEGVGPVTMEGTSSSDAEAYRALRTSIRFLAAQQPLDTLVVTSAEAGEGKTTVAANLAVAIAQAGERVILIDADLRKPKLSAVFDIADGREGLTDVVLGRVGLDEALVPWRGLLSVLPAGALPPNPSEVLGSEAMAKVLAEAAGKADVVVLDAAPLLPVTDAAVLSTLVDGVVLVSRWGVSPVAAGEETRFILEGLDANVVGVALNGVRGLRSRRYYQDYGSTSRARG